MAARGIEAVPQMIFHHEFGEMYVQNLGPARAAASNPMRAWIDAGMHPAAGSDAPVSATSPFLNIHAMVTRRTNHGTLLGPEQRSAWPRRCTATPGPPPTRSSRRAGAGRLVPGQVADIAVLSRTFFQSTRRPSPRRYKPT